jgi:hypothetical protein
MALSAAEVRRVREYRLPLPEDRRILFEMAVTPEQDVLSFVVNKEGKWRLSRVRGWLDKEPKEDTIVVPGLAPGDRKQWVAPFSAGLLVTPDGRFAICIASGSRAPNRTNVELVSVVDLSEFKVVTSVHAADLPVLAGAFRTYRFDSDRHLIVQAFTPFQRRHGDDVSSGGSQVTLAALSLPDLTVTGQCQYSEWIRNGAPVHRDGEQACATLVSSAGDTGSLSKFLDDFVMSGGVERYAPRDDSPCPGYVSRDGRFEREICQESHRGFWGNQVVTKSVENIEAVETGKRLGSITEPVHESVRSSFASMNGRDYLLLMENGVRLLVYAIPE